MESQQKLTASVFRDPIVVVLGIIAAMLIVGALLTFVFAIINGVFTLDDTPRTFTSFNLASARRNLQIAEEKNMAEAWGGYIMALADNERMSEAKAQLAEAQAADLDVTRTQALKFAEAYLLELEGRDDEAALLYQELSDDLVKAYEQELERGGDKNWAIADGIPQNFLLAQVRLADIARRQGDLNAAVEYLSVYLEYSPMNAGIMVDRGNARLELGDKEGARKDFTEAQRFLPDDPDVLAGLEKAKE